MKKIKRYTQGNLGMLETNTGEWVKWEDADEQIEKEAIRSMAFDRISIAVSILEGIELDYLKKKEDKRINKALEHLYKLC